MPRYLIRDLPPDLWLRVKSRAHREGHDLRPVFLALLRQYAEEGAAALPRQACRPWEPERAFAAFRPALERARAECGGWHRLSRQEKAMLLRERVRDEWASHPPEHFHSIDHPDRWMGIIETFDSRD